MDGVLISYVLRYSVKSTQKGKHLGVFDDLRVNANENNTNNELVNVHRGGHVNRCFKKSPECNITYAENAAAF